MPWGTYATGKEWQIHLCPHEGGPWPTACFLIPKEALEYDPKKIEKREMPIMNLIGLLFAIKSSQIERIRMLIKKTKPKLFT